VKAGDGTILATSPPYTRFITSGVDFAIISPGITRADVWVQEFLKHKIPCIVADYLVDYVCKPGNSLERHVLYNTNDLAEKSFSNLLSKAKVIPEDLTMSKDCDGGDDIACEVCCSCDRGEDMLICGDECGSVGCGAGIHIDCCDPPLESIPEEDWFCPTCSGSRSTSPKKKRIKKALH
jgi:topoisomerase (DNA) II binding protein 1